MKRKEIDRIQKVKKKKLVLVYIYFFKNRIRIESARVRGSNKDGRDVFLAVS